MIVDINVGSFMGPNFSSLIVSFSEQSGDSHWVTARKLLFMSACIGASIRSKGRVSIPICEISNLPIVQAKSRARFRVDKTIHFELWEALSNTESSVEDAFLWLAELHAASVNESFLFDRNASTEPSLLGSDVLGERDDNSFHEDRSGSESSEIGVSNYSKGAEESEGNGDRSIVSARKDQAIEPSSEAKEARSKELNRSSSGDVTSGSGASSGDVTSGSDANQTGPADSASNAFVEEKAVDQPADKAAEKPKDNDSGVSSFLTEMLRSS